MRFLCLVTLTALLLGSAVVAQIGETPNPYGHINTDADAQALFKDVRAKLLEMFGMSVQTPVVLKLVDGPGMDALFSNSPYKGAEIGLYRTESDGLHHLYILTDDSRDAAGGTMAHEFTHAWQHENCPYQDLPLKEGFAVWIAYKYLDATGAITLATNQKNHEDPVYGVGIKTMLAWEDKVGEKGMVERVKRAHSINETP